MNLEELDDYQMSMENRGTGWSIVSRWESFAKDTVGKQLVKAVDPMAVN